MWRWVFFAVLGFVSRCILATVFLKEQWRRYAGLFKEYIDQVRQVAVLLRKCPSKMRRI
jgi:hypothetical protein